ncbi:MAG TPA: penicillin-binding protein 2 [Candidatus Faecisoma merdavium]|nr:penicillin-binding protein 2 [Candidatus Faecisoma merdavium]
MKKYKKIYNVTSKKRNIKDIIEKRYIIMIIIICIVMIVLGLNLFFIQVIKHDFYVNKVEQLNRNVIFSNSTPRGRIYDRNGKIIVDNESVKVIYYEKPNGVTTKEEIEVAYKVADMIEIDYELEINDLKKFWILNNKEESNNLITDEEWRLLEERKLTNLDIENLKIERINDQLDEFTDKDKKAASIYYLMNVGYSYDEKIIKDEDVTDKEYALIAENINNIKGFDVRLDWNRVYPYGDVFKSILGNVSKTGIPYELKDYYLNLGYSLDDRVGTSYLEYQYESILKGEKVSYQIMEDGSKKIINQGSRGKDIVLTIDIELQKEIEKILEEEVIKGKSYPNTKYYNRSFVIISDPNTGEILAMAGKQVIDGKIYDYTPGIVTTPVTAGSIVKGASHAVGYKTGALKIGDVRYDECIKIADTPLKCSWTNLGNLNDIQALKYSSNVYQFYTAFNVGGGNYSYNEKISINPQAFETYRNMFKQFGLGVKTEIDLPIESLGYTSNSTLPGHLLDFSIGQFDTYTPIQLSQYINTIANGGSRMKPYLLKAVYNPTKDGLTDLLYETKPTILNEVSLEDEYIKRIQAGFREVMTTSGTGVGFIDSKYNPAGKTGTSESFIDSDGDGVVDKQTMTNTFGGYAPYDNPKVSFVVISPDIFYKETSTSRAPINKNISYRISQKYFEFYK